MAHREFTDLQGRRWEVWEVYPRAGTRPVLPELAEGWLAFESSWGETPPRAHPSRLAGSARRHPAQALSGSAVRPRAWRERRVAAIPRLGD